MLTVPVMRPVAAGVCAAAVAAHRRAAHAVATIRSRDGRLADAGRGFCMVILG